MGVIIQAVKTIAEIEQEKRSQVNFGISKKPRLNDDDLWAHILNVGENFSYTVKVKISVMLILASILD